MIERSRSATWNGSAAIAPGQPLGDVDDLLGPGRCSTSTANSSPPQRRRCRGQARAARSRRPACASSRSPAPCPTESLIAVKPSRSRKMAPVWLAGRHRRPAAAGRTASFARSSRYARFGRPVRPSWKVRCVTCWRSATWSLTSRAVTSSGLAAGSPRVPGQRRLRRAARCRRMPGPGRPASPAAPGAWPDGLRPRAAHWPGRRDEPGRSAPVLASSRRRVAVRGHGLAGIADQARRVAEQDHVAGAIGQLAELDVRLLGQHRQRQLPGAAGRSPGRPARGQHAARDQRQGAAVAPGDDPKISTPAPQPRRRPAPMRVPTVARAGTVPPAAAAAAAAPISAGRAQQARRHQPAQPGTSCPRANRPRCAWTASRSPSVQTAKARYGASATRPARSATGSVTPRTSRSASGWMRSDGE